MKLSRRWKKRILHIDSIKERLLPILDHIFLNFMIGMLAFSRCDSISSFAGESKHLETTAESRVRLPFLSSWRNMEYFQRNDLSIISSETLPCFSIMPNLYAVFIGKQLRDVNLLQYQLYCAKDGRVEPDALPPCKATLSLHIKRANYHAAIWRKITCQMP